jgi:hypothetical protein
MYDTLCTSASAIQMKLTVLNKNEVFSQNGLWSFTRLFPEYLTLENLWNAPRQF